MIERQSSLEKENANFLSDKIMSAEEYSKLEHTSPYVFELKSGDKELCYFGVYHSSNPEDELFTDIEHKLNEVHPDLIMVEGIENASGRREEFERIVKDRTRKEIIEIAGEPGFTIMLGIQQGIECQSPEPKDFDMYNTLLEQGFSKEHIFAEQILLILPQYHRSMEQKGFKEYAQHFVDSFKKHTNWNDFEYSYENALRIAEEITGNKIDVETEENPIRFVDPIPWEHVQEDQTVLNEIARAASLYRDRFMVGEIAEAMKTHRKIFVVYGSSHAVMQEPALRETVYVPDLT